MNFSHIRFNQFISFLLCSTLFLFGCQLTSILGDGSAPAAAPPATKEILPTRSVATVPAEVEIVPTTDASAQIQNNPPPTLPSANQDPPETTDPNLDQTGETVFESPAGYQVTHPKTWIATDYFGQTVLTNSATMLNENSSLLDQPMVLIASGSANGQTAISILNSVQQELLGTGSLVQTSPVLPTRREGATGMKSAQRLTLADGILSVDGESLINGDLYVVTLTIIPENTAEADSAAAAKIMQSVLLTRDQFMAELADYGISPEEVAELNQEFADLNPIPAPSQPIGFGETEATLGTAGAMTFEFSTDGANPINLNVIPRRQDFDLTIDILDSAGSSLLADGMLQDNGKAGEVEFVTGLPLPTGTYQLVVRGFGFTSGPFTIQLSN